ncbi:hypothetical protein PVT68_04500 [Microbulbifer bruguierae]|uniref:CPBP family intramembrane metalloprotease n=1 Tax=Microbulbifer bruguierae TaxID=3029061 RepID=A0ABY8NGH9_9GAMM|nr:hypothetical protein [Microbulbifer bruguierae]WGL17555.1 hypothetical protein PVT68_04500 [Microbulbifer bruguierae]
MSFPTEYLSVHAKTKLALYLIGDILWRRKEISPARYVAVATVLSFSLTTAAALSYQLVGTMLTNPESLPGQPREESGLVINFFAVCVLAPAIETLFIGFLVAFARIWTERDIILIAAVAIPFGIMHGLVADGAFYVGLHIFASTISFIIFSTVYLAWLRRSLKAAFGICSGVHMLHNFAAFSIFFTGNYASGS